MNLSNKLTALSEDAKAATLVISASATASAHAMLKLGQILIEAKTLCVHGEWLPFLERAGINARTASRYVKLARSGIKSDTVSDLGGLIPSLRYISQYRDFHSIGLPSASEVLCGRSPPSSAMIFIWESVDHPGFFHILRLPDDATGDCALLATNHPVAGKLILDTKGEWFDPVWATLEELLEETASDWRFHLEPKEPGYPECVRLFALTGDESHLAGPMQ